MDIDVRIGKESLNINIDNPYRFDISQVTESIVNFGKKTGVDLTRLKIDRLITRMIRGVAGCEGGCPADAKSLVREGFGDFVISYVEGGILTAVYTFEDGKPLEVKIFPEFN
jgi:hypothetical protein